MLPGMRLPMSQEFRDQWRRYDLRFCCEDCVHLDLQTQKCAHGWPDQEHRVAYYEDQKCEELVFCKEFELL